MASCDYRWAWSTPTTSSPTSPKHSPSPQIQDDGWRDAMIFLSQNWQLAPRPLRFGFAA